MHRLLALTICCGAILTAGGCAELAYYGHAFSGQVEVLNARRPFGEVLDDPATSPALRSRILAVRDMRAFAERELGLPASDSFRAYADLGRPYPLWNLYATPAFSVTPKPWCYPLLGCVNYRSYFDKQRARRQAQRMRDAGWDAYLAPAPAYSTGGCFDDPLYNGMLRYNDTDLAAMLFHELAHERLYVPGDTTFTESFAMTVQMEGVRQWLHERGETPSFAAYSLEKKRDDEFVALLLAYRKRLATLYARGGTLAGMGQRKQGVFEELREAYAGLKRSWDGYAGYDSWFARGLNNAMLAPVATYNDHVPALRALFARERGDWSSFYRVAQALADLPETERKHSLRALAAAVP